MSSNDDRVFAVSLRCVIELIKSDKFPELMEKEQFASDLVSKLNSLIKNIYIQFIEDIPPSCTLSAYRAPNTNTNSSESKKDEDEEEEEETLNVNKSRLLSEDLPSTRMVCHVLSYFE